MAFSVILHAGNNLGYIAPKKGKLVLLIEKDHEMRLYEVTPETEGVPSSIASSREKVPVIMFQKDPKFTRTVWFTPTAVWCHRLWAICEPKGKLKEIWCIIETGSEQDAKLIQEGLSNREDPPEEVK